MLDIVMSCLQEKFEKDVLDINRSLNKLENEFDFLLKEIKDKELRNKVDELNALILAEYVSITFENGVKYGLKLNEELNNTVI